MASLRPLRPLEVADFASRCLPTNRLLPRHNADAIFQHLKSVNEAVSRAWSRTALFVRLCANTGEEFPANDPAFYRKIFQCLLCGDRAPTGQLFGTFVTGVLQMIGPTSRLAISRFLFIEGVAYRHRPFNAPAVNSSSELFDHLGDEFLKDLTTYLISKDGGISHHVDRLVLHYIESQVPNVMSHVKHQYVQLAHNYLWTQEPFDPRIHLEALGPSYPTIATFVESLFYTQGLVGREPESENAPENLVFMGRIRLARQLGMTHMVMKPWEFLAGKRISPTIDASTKPRRSVPVYVNSFYDVVDCMPNKPQSIANWLRHYRPINARPRHIFPGQVTQQLSDATMDEYFEYYRVFFEISRMLGRHGVRVLQYHQLRNAIHQVRNVRKVFINFGLDHISVTIKFGDKLQGGIFEARKVLQPPTLELKKWQVPDQLVIPVTESGACKLNRWPVVQGDVSNMDIRGVDPGVKSGITRSNADGSVEKLNSNFFKEFLRIPLDDKFQTWIKRHPIDESGITKNGMYVFFS